MDQADNELRKTIKMIWPFQAKKMLDLLVPPNERLNRNNLTVGKIYAGLLILHSWRKTRFGQVESGASVSWPHDQFIQLLKCVSFSFGFFFFIFSNLVLIISRRCLFTLIGILLGLLK